MLSFDPKNFTLLLSLTTFLFVAVLCVNASEKDSDSKISEMDKSPTKGPVFTSYGPVYKMENKDVELRSNHRYKVVFDITKASNEKFQLNRRLESVARFINMHVMNGVKLENIDLAVVIHGAATRDGLTQDAYQERYFDENPTLELIEQLAEKGVKFYQCGQSIEFMGIEKEEFAPQIKIALSAMTMLSTLQSDGYSFVPL